MKVNEKMEFKPVTISAIEELLPFAKACHTRSCDYTPGNLVMWARFMDYRYAIENGTLFIRCKSQHDMESSAFLAPIGSMPMVESLRMLQEHCCEKGENLRLTAVPEEIYTALHAALPDHQSTTLDNWSDYIYSAVSLATLKGKALNKKRNRYNKFIAENPIHNYSRCTADDIKDVVRFLAGNRDCQHNREDNMRCYEQWQCIATVRNLTLYSQHAGILRVDGKIAAFTLGEIFGDTLYVHIEKADHSIVGASEAINRMFVSDMLGEHPGIIYVNREEDLGDPGLRQVKRAYAPIMMLQRYEMWPKEQSPATAVE